MYELRLKNFIIFRNAKLYDEIVPQMQEHYCDFHGFSLDLKRPLDEKLCEHMFSFLNIKYEELVNNNEGTVKNIINYCQLEWSEKCLNHHDYVAPIKTLSLNQANKPVYSSSIGSSNNYDIYLRKMFDNLDLKVSK